MSGKEPHLSPLEARKRLLIAESELNRATLVEEWQTIRQELSGLAHRAKTVGGWVSAAALLAGGVTACRGAPSEPAPSKVSWLQKLLRGARLALTIWLALRPRDERTEARP